MQTHRALMHGTTAAMLLVFGASTSRAQSLPAAPYQLNQAGGEQSRTASFSNSHHVLTDSVLSTAPAPMLPPPQMSRKRAIVLGMVIGGAVGATAGYFIAHDSCETCDDSGPVVLVSTVGAVAGAALGGFVAAQNSPAGPSQSSLRSTSAHFLALPHPIVRYQLATFR